MNEEYTIGNDVCKISFDEGTKELLGKFLSVMYEIRNQLEYISKEIRSK